MSYRLFKPRPEQIEAWVLRHFPDCKRRKNGEEININNIDGDTNFHFGINTKKAQCHDWRPGHQSTDGSFIKFVQRYRNISFHEAVKEVCGADINLRSLLLDKEPKEEENEAYLSLPDGSTPFSERGKSRLREVSLNYLKSRGIPESRAIQYNLHFTASGIVFPYYEYEILVYWQSRSIIGKDFLFPLEEKVGVKKTQFVYGFDHVEPLTDVIVVESIFGAFAIGEDTVATGGASMDKAQVRKIRALRPERVILAPDNDEAGRKSLCDNFFKLDPYFHGKIWFSLPPANVKLKGKNIKDWSELGEKFGWDAPKKILDAGLSKLDQSKLMQESLSS